MNGSASSTDNSVARLQTKLGERAFSYTKDLQFGMVFLQTLVQYTGHETFRENPFVPIFRTGFNECC